MKGKTAPEKEVSPELLTNEAVIADGKLYFLLVQSLNKMKRQEFTSILDVPGAILLKPFHTTPIFQYPRIMR